MRTLKTNLVIAVLLFLSVSTAAADATQRSIKDPAGLAADFYRSAYLFESAGDYLKASEGYVFILANYPDDQDTARASFERLKGIYEKVLGGLPPPSQLDQGFYLSYLRNIYNNYKTEGQYEKAIRVLKSLTKIEERPEYLSDLANIYLYGLNDPKQAIEYFEKSISLGTADYKVDTDLGLAYELFGDHERAVASYRKAAKASPSDPWVIYGLNRVKGIELAADKQLIKDWFFIGPFFPQDMSENAEDAWVAAIDTAQAFKTSSGDTRIWLRPYARDEYGFVNLNSVCQPASFASAYAMTYIYSPEPARVLFKAGSDDGIVMWLNGKKVWDNPTKRPAAPDDDTVEVPLERGWNSIVLKITQDWGGWGFYFRVTDQKGSAIPDLIFDPGKDELRMRESLAVKHKEKMLKRATYFSLYGVLLLFGIILAYLIISNVRTMITIRQMRKDFSSSITHDLKGPVSAIMISAEMLLDGSVKDPARQKEYYRAIAGEAGRLNRYIHKILEFAREKKKDPYVLKRMNIVPVLERAVTLYKEESVSSGLEITFKRDREEIFVRADEGALTQAVINLLSNADKYSLSDKKIELSVSLTRDKVEIAVKDHGIGIAKKDRAKVFKKYHRADNALKAGVQGIGLGLAFVKNIVEYHRGSIRLESTPGEGSVFLIELPVEA